MTDWRRTILLAVCAAVLNWFAPSVASGVRVECGTAAAMLAALSQPLPATVIAAAFAAVPALVVHRDPLGAALILIQCLALWGLCRRLAPLPSALVFWTAAVLVLPIWLAPLSIAVFALTGLADTLLAELWLRTLGERWDFTPAPGAARVTFKSLTIAVLGSTAGLLALIALVLAGRSEREKQAAMEAAQLKQSVALRCDRADSYLDQHIQAMKTLAGFIEESRVRDPEALSRLLARTRSAHPGFSSVGITSDSGFVMARAGKSAHDQPCSLESAEFFSQAKSAGNIFVSGWTLREDTGESSITIASPIWNGGAFAGIVEGTLDPVQLQRALVEVPGGLVFPFRVLDGAGIPVAESNGFTERGSYAAQTRYGEWKIQSSPPDATRGGRGNFALLWAAAAGALAVIAMVPLGSILASTITAPLDRLGRRISAFHAAEPVESHPLPVASPEEVLAVERRLDEMSTRLLPGPGAAADLIEDR